MTSPNLLSILGTDTHHDRPHGTVIDTHRSRFPSGSMAMAERPEDRRSARTRLRAVEHHLTAHGFSVCGAETARKQKSADVTFDGTVVGRRGQIPDAGIMITTRVAGLRLREASADVIYRALLAENLTCVVRMDLSVFVVPDTQVLSDAQLLNIETGVEDPLDADAEQILDFYALDRDLFADRGRPARWVAQNFTPEEAREWTLLLGSSDDAIARARHWKLSGYTPRAAERWVRRCFQCTPTIVARLGEGDLSDEQIDTWSVALLHSGDPNLLIPFLMQSVTSDEMVQITERVGQIDRPSRYFAAADWAYDAQITDHQFRQLLIYDLCNTKRLGRLSGRTSTARPNLHTALAWLDIVDTQDPDLPWLSMFPRAKWMINGYTPLEVRKIVELMHRTGCALEPATFVSMTAGGHHELDDIAKNVAHHPNAERHLAAAWSITDPKLPWGA